MKKILFLSFFAFCFISLKSQSLDSLENALKTYTKKDTVRVNLLIKYVQKNKINDGNDTNKVNEIIEISDAIKSYDKLGKGYYLKAVHFLNVGENEIANLFFEKAKENYSNAKNQLGVATCLRGKARVLQRKGIVAEALTLYFNCLTICESIKDDHQIAISSIDIGVCFDLIGKYEKSISYYMKSVKYGENANNKVTEFIALQNISRIYSKLKQHQIAKEFAFKTLDKIVLSKDSSYLASCFQRIGNIYDDLKQSDSSLIYYFKSLELNTHYKNKIQQADNFANIGIIYSDKNKYSLAYFNYIKALEIYKNIDASMNICDVQLNISELFQISPDSFFTNIKIPLQERYNKSIFLMKNNIQISSESVDIENQKLAWESLSKIYNKTGEYKNAYTALFRAKILSDSIYKTSKVEEITSKVNQLEYEKKEAVLKAENGAKVKQQKYIQYTIGGGALLLGLGSIFFFRQYKRKQNAQIEQAETEFKNEIIDTEIKALRAQMNPHFIFNSLNSISDYMNKNEIPQADKYLTKFAKLMRLVLENSEQKDVSIAQDITALELYMELEAMRLHNKFTFKITIDKAIDKEATLLPPLILQPFVENSIWHGIAPKDGAGHISIKICKENEHTLKCIIEDDGVGRVAKNIIKHNNIEEKLSLGMKITQKRIDILNTIKNSNAYIELFDLNPGLKVEVNLPLQFE